MTLEDVIEALNRYIDKRRETVPSLNLCHLVLQRTIEPHETFRSYKKYSLILWVVQDGQKGRLLTL